MLALALLTFLVLIARRVQKEVIVRNARGASSTGLATGVIDDTWYLPDGLVELVLEPEASEVGDATVSVLEELPVLDVVAEPEPIRTGIETCAAAPPLSRTVTMIVKSPFTA